MFNPASGGGVEAAKDEADLTVGQEKGTRGEGKSLIHAQEQKELRRRELVEGHRRNAEISAL